MQGFSSVALALLRLGVLSDVSYNRLQPGAPSLTWVREFNCIRIWLGENVFRNLWLSLTTIPVFQRCGGWNAWCVISFFSTSRES